MTTAENIMRKTFCRVDINDTVSEMLGKLKKRKMHNGIVFEGKKYLGVVGKDFLITSRIDAKSMHVKNLIKKRSKTKTPFYVPKLTPKTDIREICRLLTASNTKVLPVIKNNKVIGVVNAKDVGTKLAPEYKKVSCEEISTTKLITVKGSDELGKIIKSLHWNKISHIPVVDRFGRLEGVFCSGNLIDYHIWNAYKGQRIPQAASHQNWSKRGFEHGEKINILKIPVKQFMIPATTTCCIKPETKVSTALKLMSENDITNAILVREKKPVGIITLRDVFLDYLKPTKPR